MSFFSRGSWNPDDLANSQSETQEYNSWSQQSAPTLLSQDTQPYDASPSASLTQIAPTQTFSQEFLRSSSFSWNFSQGIIPSQAPSLSKTVSLLPSSLEVYSQTIDQNQNWIARTAESLRDEALRNAKVCETCQGTEFSEDDSGFLHCLRCGTQLQLASNQQKVDTLQEDEGGELITNRRRVAMRFKSLAVEEVEDARVLEAVRMSQSASRVSYAMLRRAELDETVRAARITLQVFQAVLMAQARAVVDHCGAHVSVVPLAGRLWLRMLSWWRAQGWGSSPENTVVQVATSSGRAFVRGLLQNGSDILRKGWANFLGYDPHGRPVLPQHYRVQVPPYLEAYRQRVLCDAEASAALSNPDAAVGTVAHGRAMFRTAMRAVQMPEQTQTTTSTATSTSRSARTLVLRRAQASARLVENTRRAYVRCLAALAAVYRTEDSGIGAEADRVDADTCTAVRASAQALLQALSGDAAAAEQEPPRKVARVAGQLVPTATAHSHTRHRPHALPSTEEEATRERAIASVCDAQLLQRLGVDAAALYSTAQGQPLRTVVRVGDAVQAALETHTRTLRSACAGMTVAGAIRDPRATGKRTASEFGDVSAGDALSTLLCRVVDSLNAHLQQVLHAHRARYGTLALARADAEQHVPLVEPAAQSPATPSVQLLVRAIHAAHAPLAIHAQANDVHASSHSSLSDSSASPADAAVLWHAAALAADVACPLPSDFSPRSLLPAFPQCTAAAFTALARALVALTTAQTDTSTSVTPNNAHTHTAAPVSAEASDDSDFDEDLFSDAEIEDNADAVEDLASTPAATLAQSGWQELLLSLAPGGTALRAHPLPAAQARIHAPALTAYAQQLAATTQDAPVHGDVGDALVWLELLRRRAWCLAQLTHLHTPAHIDTLDLSLWRAADANACLLARAMRVVALLPCTGPTVLGGVLQALHARADVPLRTTSTSSPASWLSPLPLAAPTDAVVGDLDIVGEHDAAGEDEVSVLMDAVSAVEADASPARCDAVAVRELVQMLPHVLATCGEQLRALGLKAANMHRRWAHALMSQAAVVLARVDELTDATMLVDTPDVIQRRSAGIRALGADVDALSFLATPAAFALFSREGATLAEAMPPTLLADWRAHVQRSASASALAATAVSASDRAAADALCRLAREEAAGIFGPLRLSLEAYLAALARAKQENQRGGDCSVCALCHTETDRGTLCSACAVDAAYAEAQQSLRAPAATLDSHPQSVQVSPLALDAPPHEASCVDACVCGADLSLQHGYLARWSHLLPQQRELYTTLDPGFLSPLVTLSLVLLACTISGHRPHASTVHTAIHNNLIPFRQCAALPLLARVVAVEDDTYKSATVVGTDPVPQDRVPLQSVVADSPILTNALSHAPALKGNALDAMCTHLTHVLCCREPFGSAGRGDSVGATAGQLGADPLWAPVEALLARTRQARHDYLARASVATLLREHALAPAPVTPVQALLATHVTEAPAPTAHPVPPLGISAGSDEPDMDAPPQLMELFSDDDSDNTERRDRGGAPLMPTPAPVALSVDLASAEDADIPAPPPTSAWPQPCAPTTHAHDPSLMLVSSAPAPCPSPIPSLYRPRVCLHTLTRTTSADSPPACTHCHPNHTHATDASSTAALVAGSPLATPLSLWEAYSALPADAALHGQLTALWHAARAALARTIRRRRATKLQVLTANAAARGRVDDADEGAVAEAGVDSGLEDFLTEAGSLHKGPCRATLFRPVAPTPGDVLADHMATVAADTLAPRMGLAGGRVASLRALCRPTSLHGALASFMRAAPEHLPDPALGALSPAVASLGHVAVLAGLMAVLGALLMAPPDSAVSAWPLPAATSIMRAASAYSLLIEHPNQRVRATSLMGPRAEPLQQLLDVEAYTPHATALASAITELQGLRDADKCCCLTAEHPLWRFLCPPELPLASRMTLLPQSSAPPASTIHTLSPPPMLPPLFLACPLPLFCAALQHALAVHALMYPLLPPPIAAPQAMLATLAARMALAYRRIDKHLPPTVPSILPMFLAQTRPLPRAKAVAQFLQAMPLFARAAHAHRALLPSASLPAYRHTIEGARAALVALIDDDAPLHDYPSAARMRMRTRVYTPLSPAALSTLPMLSLALPPGYAPTPVLVLCNALHRLQYSVQIHAQLLVSLVMACSAAYAADSTAAVLSSLDSVAVASEDVDVGTIELSTAALAPLLASTRLSRTETQLSATELVAVLVTFLYLTGYQADGVAMPAFLALRDSPVPCLADAPSPLAQALLGVPSLARVRAMLASRPRFTSARCVFADPDVHNNADDDVELVSSVVSLQTHMSRAVSPAALTLVLEGVASLAADAPEQTVTTGPLRHCTAHPYTRSAPAAHTAAWTELLDAVRAVMPPQPASRAVPPPLQELAAVTLDAESAAQARATYFRKALEFYAYSHRAHTPLLRGPGARVFAAAAGACMITLADRVVLVQTSTARLLSVSMLHVLHALSLRADMRACAMAFPTSGRQRSTPKGATQLLCVPKFKNARDSRLARKTSAAYDEDVSKAATDVHHRVLKYFDALYTLACDLLGVRAETSQPVVDCIVGIARVLEGTGRA